MNSVRKLSACVAIIGVLSFGCGSSGGHKNNGLGILPQIPTALIAPTALNATTSSSSQINLAWTDNSSIEDGFKIERKTGVAGTYSVIATLTANTTTYQDTGLAEDTPYYYKLCAYNSAGNSAYSNEANTTTKVKSAIVYDDDSDGDREIYIADIDGTNVVKLTNNSVDDGNPKFSPDGRTIAFLSNRDYANGELYTMMRDGSNVQRITNSAIMGIDFVGFWGRLAWSPNGTKIMFSADVPGGTKEPDIYVINPDGTGLASVISTTDDDVSGGWSANNKLTFFRNTPYNGYTAEVWTANADGTNQTQLTTNPGPGNANASQPVWSPDGSKIFYTADKFAPEDQLDVWVMNADGTGQTNLSNTSTLNEVTVAWTPDDKLYFLSDPGYFTTAGEIWRRNSDGSGMVQITSRGGVGIILWADVFVAP